jgi:ParB/RepB/Spo0J family partition protein
MQSNIKINEGYSSPEIKIGESIIQNLPLKSLVPMELSVRLTIDEAEIEALAESVKIHGILEPLLVRPTSIAEGKFEIICGNRRFIAAQKAGLKAVPCIVKMMNACESMEATLVENIQRENLSDYELGRWFKLMMERFPDRYPSQQAIADVFGLKADVQVARLIKHYEFLEQMSTKLPANILPRGRMLPERLTREVRRVQEDIQPKLVEYLSEHERSVRDVAGVVDVLLETPEYLREKVLNVVFKKDLNARETAELVKVLSAHSVIIGEKPSEGEKLKTPEKLKKPKEGEGVTVPEGPEQKPEEPKLPEGTPEQLDKLAEEIKAKGLQQKYDKAGQIYIFLSNYYPQQIIDAFTDHIQLERLTEEKAVAMMKDIVAEMCDRLTNYGRKHEVLDEIFETVVKWH